MNSVITVRLLETNIDVNETTGSTQLCFNVTHGNVESYAYLRYSTISGSATGMHKLHMICYTDVNSSGWREGGVVV